MPPAAHPLDDYHLVVVSLESHLHTFAVRYHTYEMIRKKKTAQMFCILFHEPYSEISS